MCFRKKQDARCQSITVCCSVLQYVAVCCIVLHRVLQCMLQKESRGSLLMQQALHKHTPFCVYYLWWETVHNTKMYITSMNRRVSQPPLTTSLSLLLSFSISLSHHLSPSLSIALSFITHSPSPSPFNFPSLSFRFLLPRSTSEGSRSEPSFPVPPPPIPPPWRVSAVSVQGGCRKKGEVSQKEGGVSHKERGDVSCNI